MRPAGVTRIELAEPKVRPTTIQLPEEAVWDLADGQRFTAERYPGGQIVLSPAGVAVQPP